MRLFLLAEFFFKGIPLLQLNEACMDAKYGGLDDLQGKPT
jgi:hypothetical protein